MNGNIVWNRLDEMWLLLSPLGVAIKVINWRAIGIVHARVGAAHVTLVVMTVADWQCSVEGLRRGTIPVGRRALR